MGFCTALQDRLQKPPAYISMGISSEGWLEMAKLAELAKKLTGYRSLLKPKNNREKLDLARQYAPEFFIRYNNFMPRGDEISLLRIAVARQYSKSE